MEKLRMQTADGVQDNIRKLQSLFPDCVAEAKDKDGRTILKVDKDKLLQNLSDTLLSSTEERYQFTWPDKGKALLAANAPIAATLRPCRKESLDFDNTQNLYIEGDNLDVLKCLKDTYLGKVKMIYIDPPYNTGNDFVYEDDFAQITGEYVHHSGQFDDQGRRLFANTESNGRFHTDWLNMIYPRLKVARDLLTDDGVIFISIDDHEVTNLTKVCDELFGEKNRIALICHKSRASISNDKIISPNHNTILFYSKDSTLLEQRRKMIGLDPILEGFDMDDNDGKGAYRLVPVDGPGGAKKGNPYYEFLGITGYWRFSKETMTEKYNQGIVVKRANGLYQKYFKSTAKQTRRTATTWWDDAGFISTATSRLKTLMDGETFDTPKPVELIDRMLRMCTFEDKNSIILDFFSGSATTAHAVMQLNAEDGGKRQFIMVQLPELTDEKSEAYKAGYTDICQIGKERILRAGKKIKEESPETTQDLDTGFRVLKLDSTNMEEVYYTPKDLNRKGLFDQVNNVKAGRTSEDLLFQVMLELGATLDSKIEALNVEGKTIYNVAEGYLVACFDTDVSDEVVMRMTKMKPVYAVLRDNSVAKDSTLTNFEQIFRKYSPNTTLKTL